MTIEVREKGTEEFYREVVNVVSQYRKLIKDPKAKLGDNFRWTLNSIILLVVLLLIDAILGVISRFDALTVTAVVIVTVALVFTVIVRNNLKRSLRSYLSDDRHSVVTLDENGVEINKEGAHVVRLAWEGVAFLRKFDRSSCFFSKDTMGLILAVDNSYWKEISDYIRNSSIEIMIIE